MIHFRDRVGEIVVRFKYHNRRKCFLAADWLVFRHLLQHDWSYTLAVDRLSRSEFRAGSNRLINPLGNLLYRFRCNHWTNHRLSLARVPGFDFVFYITEESVTKRSVDPSLHINPLYADA